MKPTHKYNLLLKQSVYMLVGLVFPMLGTAQMQLIIGETKPDSSIENALFWNPRTHELWGVYPDNGEWHPLSTHCKAIEKCYPFLIAKLTVMPHMAGYNYDGSVYYFSHFEHFEGLIVFDSPVQQYFFDSTGTLLAFITKFTCKGAKLEKVGNERGYSVPQLIPDHQKVYISCADFVAWGFLTTKGEWKIEPKFDEPFHFTHGIAEVLYYGVKRKINEKGEFVE